MKNKECPHESHELPRIIRVAFASFAGLCLCSTLTASAALQINDGLATGITRTNANIACNVVTTNGATNAAFVLYYGPNDHGTNATDWAYAVTTAVTEVGFKTNSILGLTPALMYYYRHYLSEGTNWDWSTASSNFTTLAGAPTSTPSFFSHTVHVSSNGTLLAPTNFFDANSNALNSAITCRTLAQVLAAGNSADGYVITNVSKVLLNTNDGHYLGKYAGGWVAGSSYGFSGIYDDKNNLIVGGAHTGTIARVLQGTNGNTIDFAHGHFHVANIDDIGTAATNATSAFATAAQGTNAATAYGWGNHATNGYATNVCVWVGSVDTNWNTAGNWSNGRVPTRLDIAIVDPSTMVYPMVGTNIAALTIVYIRGEHDISGTIIGNVELYSEDADDQFYCTVDGDVTAYGATELPAECEIFGDVIDRTGGSNIVFFNPTIHGMVRRYYDTLWPNGSSFLDYSNRTVTADSFIGGLNWNDLTNKNPSTVWYTPESEFGFDGIGTITNYYGTNAEVRIPLTIGGLAVTNIGASAFKNVQSLRRLSIPKTVLSMGNFACEYCSNLTHVVMEDGMTSMAGTAIFAFCPSLSTVRLSDEITTIGNGVFTSDMALRTVNIPSKLVTVGQAAFIWCPTLTELTMPRTVTSLGTSSFFGCSNLVSMYFYGNAPTLGSFVFDETAPVTAYYLQGRTGFDAWGYATTNAWVTPDSIYSLSVGTNVANGSGVISVAHEFATEAQGANADAAYLWSTNDPHQDTNSINETIVASNLINQTQLDTAIASAASRELYLGTNTTMTGGRPGSNMYEVITSNFILTNSLSEGTNFVGQWWNTNVVRISPDNYALHLDAAYTRTGSSVALVYFELLGPWTNVLSTSELYALPLSELGEVTPHCHVTSNSSPVNAIGINVYAVRQGAAGTVTSTIRLNNSATHFVLPGGLTADTVDGATGTVINAFGTESWYDKTQRVSYVAGTVSNLTANIIRPVADGANAIRLQNANGTTNIIDINTTGRAIGIGTNAVSTSVLTIRRDYSTDVLLTLENQDVIGYGTLVDLISNNQGTSLLRLWRGTNIVGCIGNGFTTANLASTVNGIRFDTGPTNNMFATNMMTLKATEAVLRVPTIVSNNLTVVTNLTVNGTINTPAGLTVGGASTFSNNMTIVGSLKNTGTNYLYYGDTTNYVARWSTGPFAWYMQAMSNGVASVVVTNAFTY